MYPTEKNKAEFLKALEFCLGNISKAVRLLQEKTGTSVTRSAHYLWIKEDPEYAKKAKEIRETATDFVEEKLFENIAELDTTSIIFYLKTRAKDRGYVERQEIQADVSHNSLKIEVVNTKPDEG